MVWHPSDIHQDDADIDDAIDLKERKKEKKKKEGKRESDEERMKRWNVLDLEFGNVMKSGIMIGFKVCLIWCL